MPGWEWIVGGLVVLAVLAIGTPILLRTLRYRKLLSKYNDDEIARAIVERRILEHMTREQLIEAWGAPRSREERVTKTKVVEVFKYRPHGRNRFRDKVRLENGIVVGWDQKDAPEA